jgi:hypothetical protein
MTVLVSFIGCSYLVVVVVVVLSFERVVPESVLLTLPLTVVDEVVESVLAGGVVTTVVVGAGVTTVVLFSTVVEAAGVVVEVVDVRSHAARADAPTMRAMAGSSFLFMAIAPVDCRDPGLEGDRAPRVLAGTRVGMFSYTPHGRAPSMR